MPWNSLNGITDLTPLALAFWVLSILIFVTAIAGLITVGLIRRKRDQLRNATQPLAMFLFDDGVLQVADGDAQQFMPGDKQRAFTESTLIAQLTLRFADLPRRIDAMGGHGYLMLNENNGPLALRLLRRGPLCRIEMATRTMAATDSASSEDQILRAMAEDSPQAIWVTDPDGRVLWANASYLDLLPANAPVSWPLPQVFKDSDALRTSLTVQGKVHDFSIRSSQRGPHKMHFATDITAITAAETARKQFLNGIGQIYAGLPMGIALFDASRRMMQFNPALTDLTGLSTATLLQRPTLANFLDHLRDSHLLPEPRDYLNWRARLTSLEAGHSPSLSETWHLGDGRTLRVTAQPYPDNVMALLFEDISSEVQMTRAFRAELDTLHGVIGALDEAIAVFARTGTLIVANAAYYDMWALHDDIVAPLSLDSEIARWHRQFASAALARATTGLRNSDPIALDLCWHPLDDETELRANSIGSGRVMVGFRAILQGRRSTSAGIRFSA
ncbi:PAS-domain containing protein [Ketogulonicigenium vulgare]|uniref:Sensor histidine kinase protein n=1 Tax=Ketogulonicigenium vulgare (strain WSH-001) TaxID=759362 RepID=F9Y6A6_KETVW|nr:PAS-domain containing protein [Ketogulonicigenium vulgare]ADO43844.1 Sensor protein divL [Ketogulonicigenium vulgare Y25]AEM42103.1 Sensor histidine kinase protein [Ketogulonicigenium vulgare WSH-001]ALJ79732.1 histidine kinase [Ketogulonicigenium vulgare]ANW32656.1 histidine kinase [Ketogulonicigenium vulgare]AOZ55879.1 Sensor protein divL [Ketogulonicigenium vulgare]